MEISQLDFTSQVAEPFWRLTASRNKASATESLAIGSNLRRGADELAEARPGIDPQAIFDYLYFHCIPSPRTIFAG
jgi:hypothetical protein